MAEGKALFKLTPPPKRPKLSKPERKVSSKPCYGVFFQGNPFGITYASDGSNEAIANILYRDRERLAQEGFSSKAARPLMSAVLLNDPAEWEGKIKTQKRKIEWQVCRNDKPLRKTKAVSEARARDNGWYAAFKSKEEPTTPESKQIYHEEITALPVFGQKKPVSAKRRKVSHRGQPSLFRH